MRRLNLKLRWSSIASHTPSTVLRTTAQKVKKNEFQTVRWNTSHRSTSWKFLRPMNSPGEPTQ